jgi:hypothetical protein
MSVMFLLVGHYKFVNLFMRHRTVSTGQIIFEFFLLDIVRYLTNKNVTNSIL